MSSKQEISQVFWYCCEIALSRLERRYPESSKGRHSTSMSRHPRILSVSDELRTSHGPTGAQHLLSLPHGVSARNLTYFRNRTLPPIPTPASQDVLQRALTVPNNPLRPSPHPLKQPDQRSLHVQNLPKPVEGKDYVNAGSAPGSLNLSEKTTGLPGSINPASPQPASQSDSPNTRYSLYSPVSRTEPMIAPPIASADQTRLFSSKLSPSFGAASTMLKTDLDTRVSKVSTSSMTAQSQHQMMTLETEQGPAQIPLDTKSASKMADEKRKRNSDASARFRQRRKEKYRGISSKISKLEAQERETAEERDHYCGERDYFRDLALRHRIDIAPRPLSPRHRRYAMLDRTSLTQWHEAMTCTLSFLWKMYSIFANGP